MSDEARRKGKRTSLLVRRADLSVDEFRTYWAGPHAAIAITMPGIARYTQNCVDKVVWTNAGGAPYLADGIVELEFKSEQAMAEAGSSPAVRRLLPEDEPRFLSAITLCQVPAGAEQVRSGCVKVILAARLHDGKDVANLDVVLKAAKPLAYSVDPVGDAAHREALAYENEAPHAFATLWFEAERSLTKVFSADSNWQRVAVENLKRATAWLIDPLPIVIG